MVSYDGWDIVGLVVYLSVLAGCGVFWLIVWIDRKNPLHRTRRVINGRKAMASDWKRPGYLPSNWL